VQEEMAEDEQEVVSVHWQRPNSSHSSRHSRQHSSKSLDKTRSPEYAKGQSSGDDRLATLKAYHKAKGLFFTCGEKWSRDHRCGTTVSLHVVQEMLEFCGSESVESDDSEVDLMVLSAVTQSVATNSSAIRLSCQIAGQNVEFLLDSGSSHCFVSDHLAPHLPGLCALPRQQQVRIARGGYLQCSLMAPQCVWSAGGHDFVTDFKVLPLKHYDGIVGLNWLSARGTMRMNWEQKWLSFEYNKHQVFLQGEPPQQFNSTIVELHLLQDKQPEQLPPKVQQLLTSHVEVFTPPTALPPWRACDHRIPLMDGAQPVKL
jgi:hypothetical protein